MTLKRKDILKFNKIIIKDRDISETHEAVYIKKDDNLFSNTNFSGRVTVVSTRDVLDYCNQLLDSFFTGNKFKYTKSIDLLNNVLVIQ